MANLKIGDSTLLTTDGVEVLFLPLKGHIDVWGLMNIFGWLKQPPFVIMKPKTRIFLT